MPRLSIDLPEHEHRALKSQASLEGVSIREFVRRRLMRDLQQPAGVPLDSPGHGQHADGQTPHPDPLIEWVISLPALPEGPGLAKAEIEADLQDQRDSWGDAWERATRRASRSVNHNDAHE